MPIPLRADFDARLVRTVAKRPKDGPAGAAASGAGCDLRRRHTRRGRRDWWRDAADRSRLGVKFNVEGPEGLIDRKQPGQPRLNDTRRTSALGRGRAKTPLLPENGRVQNDFR